MFTLSSILNHNAKHYTNNVAMVCEDGSTETWHQHVERVARLAAGLKKLGLNSGEHIAILSENSVEQATFSIPAIGLELFPSIKFPPFENRVGKIDCAKFAQFLFVSPTFVI